MKYRHPVAPPAGTTFFRVGITEVTPWGDEIDRGYHNQPFATREDASNAASVLADRVRRRAPGKNVRTRVVAFRSV